MVDFERRTQLQMHSRGACDQDNRSSADGRRMLFDFTSHKMSGLGNVLESIRTITTLGMSGAEDVNREASKYLIRSPESPASTGTVIFLPPIAGEVLQQSHRLANSWQSHRKTRSRFIAFGRFVSPQPSDRVYHWRNIVLAH